FGLDVPAREADAWRAAVGDATDRPSIALAPGGHAEHSPESVVRHRTLPSGARTPVPCSCAWERSDAALRVWSDAPPAPVCTHFRFVLQAIGFSVHRSRTTPKRSF